MDGGWGKLIAIRHRWGIGIDTGRVEHRGHGVARRFRTGITRRESALACKPGIQITLAVPDQPPNLDERGPGAVLSLALEVSWGKRFVVTAEIAAGGGFVVQHFDHRVVSMLVPRIGGGWRRDWAGSNPKRRGGYSDC